MKVIVAILSVVLMLIACGTTKQTSAEKAAERIETAQYVSNAVNNKHFKVNVNYVYPAYGRSRYLSYDYSLEVCRDSVVSFLPYFGRAYNIPYGGGKALNFSAPMSDYQVHKGKNDVIYVNISARTDEDNYLYTLEIFSNGSTTINVSSRERESISFSGDIVVCDNR